MKSKSKPIRGRAIKVNTKRQVACFEKDDCLIVQFKRSKPKAYNDKKKLKGFKDLTIQTSKSRMLTTIYLRKDTAEALVHLLVSYLKEEPK
jgi:hypothetical protein